MQTWYVLYVLSRLKYSIVSICTINTINNGRHFHKAQFENMHAEPIWEGFAGEKSLMFSTVRRIMNEDVMHTSLGGGSV